MKIRQGFVSNSSSTSFCIYGVCLEDSKVDYEEIEGLADAAEVELYRGDDDFKYLGLAWSTIKDDQTGLAFKQATKEKVTAICKKLKIKEKLNFDTYDETIEG